MDYELSKYYEEQFHMFSTEGWKELIIQAQGMYDAYNEVTVLDTAEDLFNTKGKLDILGWLLKWPDMVEAQYKQNKEVEANA